MATIRLSDKNVTKIPFPANGYNEVYDLALPGFGVRVGPRSKTWFVFGRIGKKQFKKTIGKCELKSYEEAYQEARDLLKQAADGRVPEKNKGELTISEVANLYYTHRKQLKASTIEDYKVRLNRYVADWMNIPITAVTNSMILDRHAKITQRSKAQADYVMRIIRALFNFASHYTGDDRLLRNPVKQLSSIGAWNKVGRKKTYLKTAQIEPFLHACYKSDTLTSDFMICLLFTGFRFSELSNLKVADYDPGRVRLWGTKTLRENEYIEVPVCDTVDRILSKRSTMAKEKGKEFIFFSELNETKRIVDLRSSRDKVLEETGIKTTFHDLRRTFLTYADEAGISVFAQKRLVGHALPSDVTEGYVQLSLARLKKDIDRLESFILVLIKK